MTEEPSASQNTVGVEAMMNCPPPGLPWERRWPAGGAKCTALPEGELLIRADVEGDPEAVAVTEEQAEPEDVEDEVTASIQHLIGQLDGKF